MNRDEASVSASVYGSDGGGPTTDTAEDLYWLYMCTCVVLTCVPFAQQGHSQTRRLVGEIETAIERTHRLVPGSDVPEIPDAHISRARGRVKIVPWLLIYCHNAFNIHDCTCTQS